MGYFDGTRRHAYRTYYPPGDHGVALALCGPDLGDADEQRHFGTHINVTDGRPPHVNQLTCLTCRDHLGLDDEVAP
jgi:hypothetical protein